MIASLLLLSAHHTLYCSCFRWDRRAGGIKRRPVIWRQGPGLGRSEGVPRPKSRRGLGGKGTADQLGMICSRNCRGRDSGVLAGLLVIHVDIEKAKIRTGGKGIMARCEGLLHGRMESHLAPAPLPKRMLSEAHDSMMNETNVRC